ncbi:MAG: hypothetical protein KF693_18290 [Nitrospira sp.]|nr:hypothetical protein [Nitrospira sp.]
MDPTVLWFRVSVVKSALHRLLRPSASRGTQYALTRLLERKRISREEHKEEEQRSPSHSAQTIGAGIPALLDRVQPCGMSASLAIGLAIESLVLERRIGMTSETRYLLQSETRGAHQSSDDWLAHLTQLQHALMICPADVQTRCELAALLERVEQYEEALFNWNTVLVRDPNHLQAREGVARCGPRAGRPLQSKL